MDMSGQHHALAALPQRNNPVPIEKDEALRYKPGGRGFASQWDHWDFFNDNPSGRTTALGSTQRLTLMSTRNISWGVKAAVP